MIARSRGVSRTRSLCLCPPEEGRERGGEAGRVLAAFVVGVGGRACGVRVGGRLCGCVVCADDDIGLEEDRDVLSHICWTSLFWLLRIIFWYCNSRSRCVKRVCSPAAHVTHVTCVSTLAIVRFRDVNSSDGTHSLTHTHTHIPSAHTTHVCQHWRLFFLVRHILQAAHAHTHAHILSHKHTRTRVRTHTYIRTHSHSFCSLREYMYVYMHV